jgi:RimJ/RimL family protein N-acetyltransferase
MAPDLHTSRLLLRRWRDDDLQSFAALNADPVVMEHYPETLSGEDGDASATRINRGLETRPFGLWAVEAVGVAPFVGYVGLSEPNFAAHFTPSIEIGWRLSREHWHQGYATEAAVAARDYAFEILRLERLVSFTVPANSRSRRVMERLGMTHNPLDDFDHPGLPEGHPLQRHVLYKLSRSGWVERSKVA